MTQDIHAGKRLLACNPKIYLRKDWAVVIVSGSNINIYGHALLNIGGYNGYYAHISGEGPSAVYPGDYPTLMDQHEYDSYLAHYGKTELLRYPVTLISPERAISELEKIYMDRWRWGLFVNNCASLVEQILLAGGAAVTFRLNLPKGILVY